MNDTLNAEALAQPAFMINAMGRKVPTELVAPADKLKDQTVRTILGYAKDLSNQVARFKGHTFDDIATMLDLLAEQYGEEVGGPKGNMQIVSFDGLQKVEVQNARRTTFGPELHFAKNLVDKCIEGWAEGVNSNIRALVEHAFEVDTQGHISVSKLLTLRRIQIEDPQWKAAMRAITESIQVIGSKSYIRFYERHTQDGEWRSIRIDLAAVERQ